MPLLCQVGTCRDRGRYVYAFAFPTQTLPPMAPFMDVVICGTHAAGPWPWPALPVHYFRGFVS